MNGRRAAHCPHRGFRASLPPLCLHCDASVPPSPSFANPLQRLPLRVLPMLLILLAADQAPAQTAVIGEKDIAPVCPVGVLRCPKRTDPYAKCKRNDLLDFFTPGLPPAGDRSKAPYDAIADKVSRKDDTHEQLEGNVQLQRLDALLKTDFLTFDTETTDYVANGHVRYQDAGTLMSADHAHGTTTPSVTFLDNVRYQMLDSRGNGVAATVNQTDPDHSKMGAGTYSTCDPSERQWEIRTSELEMDRVKNEGYGHGVTLAFDGVPFLWLPYMSWPINEERQSGFLAPSLGYSNRRGFKIGIPYYFNLAPNYDATLKPIEYTDRGPMLGGEFRYISTWDRLLLDFSYMPHDDETGQSNRGFIRLQDWAVFSPNWGATADIHHVSDNEYLHDFGDSFLTTAVSLLQSSAYVNGHGDWWTAGIGGDVWEVTDPSLESFCGTAGVPLKQCPNPVVFKPYTRLPRMTLGGTKFVDGFEFGLTSEFVNFQRSFSVTGQRLDAYPYIAYPLETSAYFVRPELGYRFTSYELSDLFYANNPLLTKSSPTRSLPIFSLDSGLIFERDSNLFGTAFTQTLEPRLFYLYVPYRNQDNLPNFDTQLPSFDFPSLFRTNTYVGADRQVNANNLTAAVTTRLINSESGDQLLSASIGQIRYLSTVRVQLPGTPDLNITGKDVIAELDLRLAKKWDLTWDQQWNPHPQQLDPLTEKFVPTDHHTDVSRVGIQHRFGAEGVINFSYNFRRGFLEQYDVTALVPLNARWSVIGRYYYSLLDKRLLETFGGVQYDSCCVAARVLLRHYLNDVTYIGNNIATNAKPDNALFFEVEFKGIGASGTRTENYLRSAILGHQ
jgi:LPS-assembly protein